MRYLWIVFCTLSLVLTFNVMDAASRSNLKDLDKPMLLDAGKSEKMYVIFNHSNHRMVRCRTCHHTGLPGNRYAACTNPACHSLQGASNRKPLSIYMAYHAPNMDRSCYGCHKKLAGKYPGFKGCGPCHKSFKNKAAVVEKKK